MIDKYVRAKVRCKPRKQGRRGRPPIGSHPPPPERKGKTGAACALPPIAGSPLSCGRLAGRLVSEELASRPRPGHGIGRSPRVSPGASPDPAEPPTSEVSPMTKPAARLRGPEPLEERALP